MNYYGFKASTCFASMQAISYVFTIWCYFLLYLLLWKGVTDGADSTPIQIRVAKLVTSAPAGKSKEKYLEELSPQIVDLIKYGININDIILQKVCVMVVTRISHICPTLCDRCILIPLSTALLNINKRNITLIKNFLLICPIFEVHSFSTIKVSMVNPGPNAIPRILAGSLFNESIISFKTNRTVGEDILP